MSADSELKSKQNSETTKEKVNIKKKEALRIEEKETSKEEKWDGRIDSTVIHGAINISKNGLGAVSLFIAGGFYEGGLVFGGFILIMSCILSATSFFIIAKCCHLTNSNSYADIFKYAFGQRFGWICSTIIGLFTTNILVLYVLILGAFSQAVFDHFKLLDWISDDVWKNVFLITLISFCIAIPLSFLRELKFFKYTSTFGLFSLIYACFLHLIVGSLGMNADLEPGTVNYWPRGLWNSIIFFATFIGGFNCHFNAANYYKSTGCNIKKFKLIIIISFSFMFVINMVMGYCAFFNDPSLFAKHDDPPSIMIFIIQAKKFESSVLVAGLLGCFFIALNIAFGFGLVGYATRLSLNEFLRFLGSKYERFSCLRYDLGQRDTMNDTEQDIEESSSSILNTRSNETQTDDRHIPLTCAVIFVVLILASIVLGAAKGDQDVSISACGFALNIAVAVFGTNVALTLPGIIYYKILRNQNYKISQLDWIIIISLTFIGGFSSIAGILKICIPKSYLS